MAPFLLAAAIGGVDAVAGSAAAGPDARVGTLLGTCAVTLAGASWLSSGVRNGSRRDLTGGVLVVAATYAAVAFGRHGGAVGAGAAGLALLALAHLAHSELDRSQALSTLPGSWPWRVTLALVAGCALLDGAVALVAGGSRPRPGSPSTPSVLVGVVVVAGVVTALTALADGVVLPSRRSVPDADDDRPL